MDILDAVDDYIEDSTPELQVEFGTADIKRGEVDTTPIFDERVIGDIQEMVQGEFVQPDTKHTEDRSYPETLMNMTENDDGELVQAPWAGGQEAERGIIIDSVPETPQVFTEEALSEYGKEALKEYAKRHIKAKYASKVSNKQRKAKKVKRTNAKKARRNNRKKK